MSDQHNKLNDGITAHMLVARRRPLGSHNKPKQYQTEDMSESINNPVSRRPIRHRRTSPERFGHIQKMRYNVELES